MFIHENAIESVVCEVASILSRPQCVKWFQKPNYADQLTEGQTMANQSSCDLRINACVWVLSNTKHKKYPELTKNHCGINASSNSVMIAFR